MSQKKRNRIFKILLFIGLGIILFLLVIQISANIFLKEIFKKNINSINKNIAPEYRIEYESVTANFLNQSLTLKNFKLTPGANLSPKLTKGGFQRKRYELHIPVLKVSGIGLFKAFIHQSLSVKNILIKNGKLKVLGPESPAKAKPVKKPRKDIFKLDGFPFSQIRVEQIKIENFSLETHRKHSKSIQKKNYLFSMIFTDVGVNVKKTGRINTGVIFTGFRTCVEDLKIVFPGKLYSLQAKRMVISEPLSRIKIHDIRLIPAYKKYIFSRQKGYRISRINGQIDRLNVYNVRFKDVFNRRCFKADLVDIFGFQVHFFRDRRLKRRSRLAIKKFPQRVFRELNYLFDVKKIKVNDGFISYEEHHTGFKTPGKIYFNDVNVVALKISNIPRMSEKTRMDNPTIVKSSSNFLGKSHFKASFIVPIHDVNDSFSFSGSLEKLRIAHLNPILKNSYLKVESGIVKRLVFHARANKYRARGRLRFFYNNLKVSLMKKRHRIKRDGAASFIANQFLKNNNPKPGRSLRIGYMYHKRIPTESMLKLIWKSFLSGVKSSVGL